MVESKNSLSKIRSSNWNVTVCRGDFIPNAQCGYSVADKNYIERAVSCYQENFH